MHDRDDPSPRPAGRDAESGPTAGAGDASPGRPQPAAHATGAPGADRRNRHEINLRDIADQPPELKALRLQLASVTAIVILAALLLLHATT